MKAFKYILAGLIFGIMMVKSEAASWFRIQEMFRFQSFHMYGIIGTAVCLGILAVWIIKKYELKDMAGQKISIQPKERLIKRYLIGGLIFGLGWALAGSCPGPMFVNLGYGYLPAILVIAGALAGTFLYGILRDKLPH